MSDSSLVEELKKVSSSELTAEQKKEAQKELIRKQLALKTKASLAPVPEKVSIVKPASIPKALPAKPIAPQEVPKPVVALEEVTEDVPEESTSEKPVLQGATLSTGDCFYSSVFRAARQQNLLNKLKVCFSTLDITEEFAFIQSLRNIIADSDILKEKLTEFYEMTQLQLTANESYSEVYSEQLNAQPEWVQTEFETLPETLEEFVGKFSEGVKTMGAWAGEFEVSTAVELLNTFCNIKIYTYNYVIVEAKLKEGEKDLIHLYNKSENHWVYYSFVVPKAFTQTKQFKEGRKKNCMRECTFIQEKITSAEKAIENYPTKQKERIGKLKLTTDKKEKEKLQKEIVYEQKRFEENQRILPELVEQKRVCDAKCNALKGGTRKKGRVVKRFTRKV
jgi:hypothetical protein